MRGINRWEPLYAQKLQARLAGGDRTFQRVAARNSGRDLTTHARSGRRRAQVTSGERKMATARKIKVRRSFGGAGLLSLLVAIACNDGPTAPSDLRPQIPSVSHTINTISSAAAEDACTFGAGYWKAHTDAWPSRFGPDAAFYQQREVLDRRAPYAGRGAYLLHPGPSVYRCGIEPQSAGFRDTSTRDRCALCDRRKGLFHRGRAYAADANRTHTVGDGAPTFQ